MKKKSENGVKKLLDQYKDELRACASISEFTQEETTKNLENICKLSNRIELFKNRIKPTPETSHKSNYAYISHAIESLVEFQRMHDESESDTHESYLSINTLTKQSAGIQKYESQKHCLEMKATTHQDLIEKQTQQLIDITIKEIIKSITRINSIEKLRRSKSARIALAKSV
ncbi:hypothetical protein [Endozoicomonas ascidiicola]|uniref:hypothetical protein n=1 Tax=Endozoicomonas ascidiicola TaxID=1698521 RepID=UPI000832C5C9|nr:hypothetical protein [Endozoicomonas ascidiicola]